MNAMDELDFDLDQLKVTELGAAAEPLSWLAVKACVAQKRFECLRRSEISLAAYRAFRKQTLESYDSMGDMVMEAKLGYPTEINPDTNKLRAVPPDPVPNKLLFVPNDFPYYYEGGVEHHVLWVQGHKLTLDLVEQQLSRYRDLSLYDLVYFINPPHLQTIPTVGHAHVLSRLKVFNAIDTSSQLQVLARTPLFRPSPGACLEVCVDSLPSALEAQAGGAHCIELCQALSEGGLTPSFGLVKSVTDHCDIPVHVMLRPRGGNFHYTTKEMSVVLADCQHLKQCPIAGFVFGALTAEGDVHVEQCQQIIDACHPFPVTFHRAIDVAKDILAAAAIVAELGFKRILTSGGAATAMQGLDTIAQLQQRVGDKVVVMAGSGLSEDNAVTIAQSTGVRHVHGSLRRTLPSTSTYKRPAVSMGSADDCKVKETDRSRVKAVIDVLAGL
eukprot:TRINITY_DN5709_c0_g2_i1.p1 TRINITY_DN5709_c0_g2~~TRINITY_DN5709_c0_g2_i1.p1  ORF type:complete len:442 (+),score=70.40 TRINITY_DN5709_c0_g2_i1:63-1388(+)